MAIPAARWALGISLALLSCFLSALGLTLQRLSTLREEGRPRLDSNGSGSSPSRWRSCLRQPMWVAGVTLYILASAPDVLSYVLVPQVVCSAVSCFRLVVVTIMSYMVLDEKLSGRQTLGMFGCSLGTFLCLAFGPVKMEKQAMTNHFSDIKVRIYLITAGVVLLVLFVLEHLDSVSGKSCARCGTWSERMRGFTLPLITGLAFAVSKVFNTEIGFIPFPHNLVLEPQWGGLAIAISMLGLTDFYLNLRATRMMAVQVFVPVSFVWCITLQYFQSAVLFEELAGLSTLHAALSICGAFVSLLGALGIMLPKKDPSDQKLTPEVDDEHGLSLEHVRGSSSASMTSNDRARVFLES